MKNPTIIKEPIMNILLLKNNKEFILELLWEVIDKLTNTFYFYGMLLMHKELTMFF